MCFIHLRKSTNLFQINISRRNRTNARQRELFRTTSHQSLPIDIMKMTTYFIISVSIYSDMIELHSLVNILIDLFGVEAKIVVVRVHLGPLCLNLVGYPFSGAGEGGYPFLQ